MSEGRYYSVKMRASEKGVHISGAEKIIPVSAVPKVASVLVERALAHSKGTPDFINLKVEAQSAALQRLKALKVTTHVTRTAEEGRAVAAELLASAGITRVNEILARFAESHSLRGAMLLDADTLERLEPDRARGVRATYMDDEASLEKGTAGGKNHYAEAIVLATKVQHAPGIVGEICVSDDPDYVTGYVATRELGYRRITVIKEKGDPNGGRIFLYRGPREGVAETVRFLEQTPVLVTDVPVLASACAAHRFDALAETLAARAQAGLSRSCRTLEAPTGPTAVADGRELVVLASNDYLDLARDPRVTEAAEAAARSWGAGSGGSRLTTGTQPPHVQLERALARFKGTDAALVYGTGYMANVGAITALVGKGDAVLSDELNHASIIDGCRLSGADVLVYRHGDLEDLDRKLGLCREHRRRLVVSDGVFSMDGDILDLPKFLEITRRHDAFSMVDEAHATGVIGATGRGLSEHFGCDHPDVLMGTLSKALGAEGGFVCGSQLMIDYLRNVSRPFIFSTAPGAPAMAAATAAIEVLAAEPERVVHLRENVKIFIAELARHGIVVRSDSAIVPILVGDEKKALAASAALEAEGILVPAIRYPTVAKGTARLRVAIMSAHAPDQLRHAAAEIAKILGGTTSVSSAMPGAVSPGGTTSVSSAMPGAISPGGTTSVSSAMSGTRTRQSASLPIRKFPSKNSVLVPQGDRAIVLFVTVNTHRRQSVLADDLAVSCILDAWRQADHWLVGRYVIMPDHIHFFCSPGSSPLPDFHKWMAYWKSLVSQRFSGAHERPLWQRECWDVQMRTVDGYREKWNYVRNNPVRKGLVEAPDEWKYQGFLNVLSWHD